MTSKPFSTAFEGVQINLWLTKHSRKRDVNESWNSCSINDLQNFHSQQVRLTQISGEIEIYDTMCF